MSGYRALLACYHSLLVLRGLIILHHCPLSLEKFSKCFWTWYSQQSLSISKTGWPAGRNLCAAHSWLFSHLLHLCPHSWKCEVTVETGTYLDLIFVLYYKDTNLSKAGFAFQILLSFVFRANRNWIVTSNETQVERNLTFFLPN